MPLAILFHFLCAQHVSDINMSIIRSLRLCCWITTMVVVFSVYCVLEIWCRWVWVVTVLQVEVQISNTQWTENATTDVVIQQQTRKLLVLDILMSKTCWAHKKWNKIASDIKLVFLFFNYYNDARSNKCNTNNNYKLWNYVTLVTCSDKGRKILPKLQWV